ncbi:hypothetical protein JXQ31_19475 [candidate division KSB1 bacterium]|nr:hypothetical protein [candidate division KSB1 bacterium]
MDANNIQTKQSRYNKRATRSGDPLSGIITGIIFILAGSFIYADNQGYLYSGWFWWLIFSMGLVFLIESVIRATVEKYKKSFHASVIWGAILTTIGANHLFDIGNWWPLILVFIGIILILSSQKNHIRQSA